MSNNVAQAVDQEEKLDTVEQSVLLYLNNAGWQTCTEIADKIGVTYNTVLRRLKRLSSLNKVKEGTHVAPREYRIIGRYCDLDKAE